MSNRLNLIAKQIKKNERVIDVGTDHCLLPIILLENDITNNIIASDLNKEPLEAGRQNLIAKGLEEKVKLVQTDGLENINLEELDVIVIAGMGATTINNMLRPFNGRYIIHSTTHIPDVRRTIQQNGHVITNEWIDKEGKIYNIVIETEPGVMELTEKELYLGPILMNNRQDSEDYYAFLLRTLTKIAKDSGMKELKLKEREWLKEQLWNE